MAEIKTNDLFVNNTIEQATLFHETEESKSNHLETMTSLQIAEVTGKQHAHVMRDIRAMIDNINKSNESTSGLVDEPYHRSDRTQYKYLSEKTQNVILDFCFGEKESQYKILESSYKDAKGEIRSMYELNKKACLLLASGYDVVLRAKIIDRWEELEMEKRSGGFQLPHTYIEALEALVASEKEKALLTQQSAAKDETIALLGNELKESAPKVRMYDEYISSDGTATTTQIAKEYGWGAETLNKKLAQLGIHYKQNGQWLLYAKYDDKGYTKSRPITFTRSDGSTCTKMQTRWTAKGREFIHDVINKLFGRVAVC